MMFFSPEAASKTMSKKPAGVKADAKAKTAETVQVESDEEEPGPEEDDEEEDAETQEQETAQHEEQETIKKKPATKRRAISEVLDAMGSPPEWQEPVMSVHDDGDDDGRAADGNGDGCDGEGHGQCDDDDDGHYGDDHRY